MEHEIAKHLDPGEHLIWEGTPFRGVMFHPIDIFLIPFSIFWFGGVLTFEGTVIASGAPAPFVLFGLFFLFIGLYLFFGRFLIDMKRRSKVTYALTDCRILILSGLFSRTLTSLSLDGLTEINFTERSDGRGSIMFGRRGWMPKGFSGMGFGFEDQTPEFERIEDAAAVLKKIRETQAQLPK